LPAAPSPFLLNKIPLLSLACGPDVKVRSFDGAALPVSYVPPTVTGGLAPVTTSCSPTSPATLAVGTQSVLCTASDSFEQGQSASCSVSLTVLPPLELSTMRFLAFGDSLTSGTVSLFLNPGSSQGYPAKLGNELSRRYIAQTFEIENAGLPAELAAQAVARFRTELLLTRPDAVLLMEGTNDLFFDRTLGGQMTVISALESMVLEAKAQGTSVLLASIPPQRRFGGREKVAAVIPDLNASIQALAFRQGVTFVDVFTALSEGACERSSGDLPCIGRDDLHPTEAGYQLMANTFADALEAEFDISKTLRLTSSSPLSTSPSSGDDLAHPRQRGTRLPRRATAGID
jgi:lysophospholipase L1-like esterase